MKGRKEKAKRQKTADETPEIFLGPEAESNLDTIELQSNSKRR